MLLDIVQKNMSVTLFTAAVVVVVAYVWLRRSRSDVYKVPGPEGAHWLWGHELDIFENAAGKRFTEWFNTFGPTVRFKAAMFHPDSLVTADPRFIKHMLTDNPYNYVKSPVFRPLVERLLGRGLVWAEGGLHKQQRRVLNPAFSAGNVRQMAPDVFDATEKMQSKLTQHLQDKGGEATVNIMRWTSMATLDIIGRVGFNFDFGCGDSPEAKEIQAAWTEQVNAGMSTVACFAQAILRTFPFLLSLPVDAIQAQGRIKVVIDAISRKMVEKGSEEEKGNNLLSIMMKANSEGGDKMTSTQIIDHISTFVVVGHETTSGTLNTTLLELANHPKSQTRLREELKSLGRSPTYEDFTNNTSLPYLDAVVKEGLRVHPPGAIMDRVAIEDDVIPLSVPVVTSKGETLHELHIRAGQFIQIPNISINRIDRVWKDGRTFRPERWIDDGGLPQRSEMQNGWSNIMSFSEGPRLCIGYRLALLEYKAILSSLILNFVFNDSGEEVETKFSATLQPRVVGKEAEGVQLPLKISLVSS